MAAALGKTVAAVSFLTAPVDDGPTGLAMQDTKMAQVFGTDAALDRQSRADALDSAPREAAAAGT
jgi:hypothetical protein